MNNYDAIIIGAGNGGLMAALTLCNASKKVLLIEKHNVPGGFATSFVRGRFEFEASLHELCDVGTEENPGNIFKMFQKYGVDIKFLNTDECFRVITLDDKNDYTMPAGIDNFINKMEEYVPGSRESMETFFDLAKETKEALAYLSESKGNPDTKVLKEKYGNFMRTAAYSVDDVLSSIKMPEKAKEILSTYWVYLGSATDTLSFSHYAIMVYNYVSLTPAVPVMTSSALSLSIASRIEELGGTILYGSTVTKVNVSKGVVTGVTIDNGKSFNSNHVIGDIAPNVLYGALMDPKNIPNKARKLVNIRELGARGFSVYLGLNRSAEALNIKNYSYFIFNSMDSSKEVERMQNIDTNNNSVVCCLNNIDPTCSPKGTCMLYFTTLYFTDTFGANVTHDNYYDLKENIALKLIEAFESATGINIKNYIEEIEIASPVTYAHYTNAMEGAIYGYKARGYDNMLPRIMNMSNEVYIKGLRFAGGFAERLDGYSSAYSSGELCGLLTIKDMEEN